MRISKEEVNELRGRGLTWLETADRLGVMSGRLDEWREDNNYEVISY